MQAKLKEDLYHEIHHILQKFDGSSCECSLCEATCAPVCPLSVGILKLDLK